MAEEDPHRHADVWSLLPLIVNGRATPAQRALAEAHLRVCADCRAALEQERALADAFALPPDGLPDAEDGLRRLMERLDHAEDLPPQPLPRPAARAPRRAWVGALAAVGLLQMALLGLIATGWRPEGDPAYRTLTQAEPHAAGPRWRVVFDEQLSLHDLQALLRQQGLVVEAGPSEAGVFTVGATVPTADPDARAAALRALPHVRFAEALPASR